MSDGPFTKSFDFDIEDNELLDELTIVDAEVHTNENAQDIIDRIEDDELRHIEQEGYLTETSRPSAMGEIPYNFYHPECGGPKGGRPFLKTPLKSVADIHEQQHDLRADKVLINTINALRIGNIKASRKREPYLRAMNRFIMDQLATDGEQYFTGVTVNPDLPEGRAEEIRKYANRDAVVYAIAPADHEKPLGNQRYEPILEACEETELPYVMHGTATHDRNDYLQFDRYAEQRALGQVLPHLRNAVSIIGEEVPERYETDMVFIEHGFGWVPFLMARLNREQKIRGFESPGLTRKPSEYLREFYYGTQPMIEPEDPEYISEMLRRNGLEDQVLYMSDYPHPDCDHVGTIANHNGLTREQKVKILQDNAHELFDI